MPIFNNNDGILINNQFLSADSRLLLNGSGLLFVGEGGGSTGSLTGNFYPLTNPYNYLSGFGSSGYFPIFTNTGLVNSNIWQTVQNDTYISGKNIVLSPSGKVIITGDRIDFSNNVSLRKINDYSLSVHNFVGNPGDIVADNHYCGSWNSDTVLNQYGFVLATNNPIYWRKSAAGAGQTYLSQHSSGILEVHNNLADRFGGLQIKMVNPYSGNVGIGTTSPVSKLDVSGNIRGSGLYLANTSNSGLMIGTITGNWPIALSNTIGNKILLGKPGSNEVSIDMPNVTTLRFNSNGAFWFNGATTLSGFQDTYISSTAAQVRLYDINDSTSLHLAVRRTSFAAGAYVYSAQGGSLFPETNWGDLVLGSPNNVVSKVWIGRLNPTVISNSGILTSGIQTSGNVGIRNRNPVCALDVSGDIKGQNIIATGGFSGQRMNWGNGQVYTFENASDPYVLTVRFNGTTIGSINPAGTINFQTLALGGWYALSLLRPNIFQTQGLLATGIGINNTNPQSVLDVSGNILASGINLYGKSGIVLSINSNQVSGAEFINYRPQPTINANITWSGSGVLFTGININFNNSGALSGSTYLNIQENGLPLLRIDDQGTYISNASIGSFTSVNPGISTFSEMLIVSGSGISGAEQSVSFNANGQNIIKIQAAYDGVSGIMNPALEISAGLNYKPSGISYTPFVFDDRSFYYNTNTSAGTGILPPVSVTGRSYKIKNRGGQLQITGRFNELIFTTTLVTNFTINSGEAYELISDGQIWNVF